MAEQVGLHAVVVGGGLAGLAAAGALSGYFERVTLIERDEPEAEPVPRSGVPQGRHVHTLLAGGLRALEELFPGLERELREDGAVPYRAGLDIWLDRRGFDPFPRRDLGWLGYTLSRPLLESCVRRLAQQSFVLRAGCRVERLTASADGARITGVECADRRGASESLSADLVVDASGRGALALGALEALGAPAPEETRIEVNFAYATGMFQIPEEPGVDWTNAMCLPDAPASGRGGILNSIEGRRWLVSLAGRGGDTPPGDWAGFLEFARGLRTSTIFDAIRRAEPIADVARFGFPASVWRHFERLPRLPSGLITVGDALCRFNPVYGQGMSVAAQEGCLLRRVLAEVAAGELPAASLGRRFHAQVPALLDGPWHLAATPDLVYPDTRGERPANLVETLQYGAALQRLAAEDPELHRLTMEVQHLLRPRSDLSAPEIRRRVAALSSR